MAVVLGAIWLRWVLRWRIFELSGGWPWYNRMMVLIESLDVIEADILEVVTKLMLLDEGIVGCS